MTNSKKIILVFTFIIFIFTILLIFLLNQNLVLSYTISAILSALIFISIAHQIKKHNIPLKYIYMMLAAGIIIRIAFVNFQPVGSMDYTRYLWDGKVQSAGINPYQYSPDDPALQNLHSKNLPRLVTFPDIKTIYPPLSQWIFYTAYKIGGESYLGLKILIIIFELFTMLGIYLILKKLKLPVKYILLYALCPLVIFQFSIDAHLDVFGLTFLIFSIYYYLDRKIIVSAIFLGASICIKPLALILIPIFFFNEKEPVKRIQILSIPILLSVLMYLPYTFSGHPFQTLINFTENWTFNGIIFDIFDSFIHNNQITRSICALLLIIAYLPVIFSREKVLTKIYLSVFLLLIFSPVVHPWYAAWLAVLLPFVPRWSGILFVSLISLTAFTILNYNFYGVWKDYPLVLALEYIPVISFFIYELIYLRTVKPIL